MWGTGGRMYWGKTEGKMEIKGIIVVFAWMWSEEKQLRPFVDLYWSLGWRCLVCHADFLNLFFPEKATTLAFDVLNELVKELKYRPSPVIFATFSGGSTVGMSKTLQLLDAKWEGEASMDEYEIIRECTCGQIYDSSPVSLITEESTHPKILSFFTKAISSSFDTLFPSSLQSQCSEYWQTLFSSVEIGPFLIFCCEEDKLAPYRSVCNSAQQLADLGADVRFIKWSSSNTGHYKFHQAEYRIAVTEFLNKALKTYSQRRKQIANKLAPAGQFYNIAESLSSETLKRVNTSSVDQFYANSRGNDSGETGSFVDEQSKELLHVPRIEPQGVLGQILYDVCVPKNIEEWDIKPGMYLKDRQLALVNSRRLGPFKPIKCLLRSRM
ncbi:hypothetical protein LUZ60_001258 [Juncus effusus]|nr:hypothetical protein LUZ60_001258 [Juncus effusus]